MNREAIVRSFVTISAGALFGLSGGYAVEMMGLNYPALIILLLFGLVSIFAIDLAADRMGVLLRRATSGRNAPGAAIDDQDASHYTRRGGLFVVSFLAGVSASKVIPMQALGGAIGNW